MEWTIVSVYSYLDFYVTKTSLYTTFINNKKKRKNYKFKSIFIHYYIVYPWVSFYFGVTISRKYTKHYIYSIHIENIYNTTTNFIQHQNGKCYTLLYIFL